MRILIVVVIGLVAAFHLYIAWFEIFSWTSKGPIVFSQLPKEIFEPTVPMAANQGIYNAFLAAGLIWSLCVSDVVWKYRIALCFLLFVAIAGVFGAFTISQRILFVQALPAILGILLIVYHLKTQSAEK